MRSGVVWKMPRVDLARRKLCRLFLVFTVPVKQVSKRISGNCRCVSEINISKTAWVNGLKHSVRLQCPALMTTSAFKCREVAGLNAEKIRQCL